MRDSPARVVAIRPPRNLGQHSAILLGLHHARGAWCAVLDADLQDSPEAITDLLAAAENCDAVFAGRRGQHQAACTPADRPALPGTAGRARRRAVGLGDVLRAPARRRGRILALPVSTPSFIAMIGLARLRAKSIPIERAQRSAGHSAYSTRLRLRLAWRMVRCVLEFRFRLVGPRDRRDDRRAVRSVNHA